MTDVLVLTADYPPRVWSGIGTAVARQCEALARRGVRVRVLVADDVFGLGSYPCSYRSLHENLEVSSLPMDRFPVDPRDFDVVHVHALRLGGLALALRERFDLPVVTTVHGVPTLEIDDRAVAEPWDARQAALLEQSDHVVVLSQAEGRVLEAVFPEVIAFPDVSSRVTQIANGLAVAQTDTAPTSRRLDGPVVFAGRFTRSKGIDVAIEAALRLLRTDTTIRFVFAGGHGEPGWAARIADLASAYPDRVDAPGWLDAEPLQEVLASAGMVLVPSRYEPFGQIAIEAMAVGTPVLASTVGGLAEVVPRGSGGCLIDSHDPRVWETWIARLRRDADLWDRLAQAGPAHVAKSFDIDRSAARLEEVYRRVVRQRHAVAPGFQIEEKATCRVF
ncbi:MAG: glycosyltransferase family 4 protein [Acidobacteriota bacterium]